MRIALWVVASLLVAVPVTAQEKPHLTLAIGYGDGLLVPRFGGSPRGSWIGMDGIRSGSIAFDARRLSLVGQAMQWPSSNALGLTVNGRVSLVKIWIFRTGVGGWYTQSTYRQQLYTGDGWSIDDRSKNAMIAGTADLTLGAPGGCPFRIMGIRGRSMLRITGIVGVARSREMLDSVIGDQAVDSPITSHISEKSPFQAARLSTTISFKGLAMDGSATAIQPTRASYAIAGKFVIFRAKATYQTPWHLGLFAEKTLVRGLPAIGVQSIEPFYGGLHVGVSVRVP